MSDKLEELRQKMILAGMPSEKIDELIDKIGKDQSALLAVNERQKQLEAQQKHYEMSKLAGEAAAGVFIKELQERNRQALLQAMGQATPPKVYIPANQVEGMEELIAENAELKARLDRLEALLDLQATDDSA